MRVNESITSPNGELLTVPEAAGLLSLKPSTIRSWLLKRKLPCVRLSARAIRIRRRDIEHIISARFIDARPEMQRELTAAGR